MITSYVEQICRSGIHFHYFCNQNSPAVIAFERSLGDAKIFSIEPVKDQKRLVKKLSKFHFGLIRQIIGPSRRISKLDDRFYQDALSMFMQSTIGTSFLVYASAGLPVLLPRWCTGSAAMLGVSALPLNLSEVPNLKSYLRSLDIEQLLKLAALNGQSFDIDNRIEELIAFCESA